MGGACDAWFQYDRPINSAWPFKAYSVPNAPEAINTSPT